MEHYMLKSILEAYNRTEISFEDDVTKLKEWIKSQPHLPEIMDDSRIKNFLLLNKCSVERSKEKIDNYYTMRTLIPELFVHPKCEEIQRARTIVNVLTLPKLTPEMSRVCFLQIRNSELLKELDPHVIVARVLHLLEVRLEEDLIFTNVFVIDMEACTLEYTFKITPTFIMKVFAVLQKVYSTRISALYVINSMPMLQPVLNLVKRFVKAKLFQRIHVYEGSAILHKIFPEEMIPRDYGGDEKSLDELSDLQFGQCMAYEARFDKLAKMKTDESLRPVPLKNDEFLGFYGNFKKLEVD